MSFDEQEKLEQIKHSNQLEIERFKDSSSRNLEQIKRNNLMEIEQFKDSSARNLEQIKRSNQLSIEEFKDRRAAISDLIKENINLERYVLIGIVAYYAWLLTHCIPRGIAYGIAWFIPVLVPVLGVWRRWENIERVLAQRLLYQGSRARVQYQRTADRASLGMGALSLEGN